MYPNLKKIFSLAFAIALCCVAPAINASVFNYTDLTREGVLQRLVDMKIILEEGITGCFLTVEEFVNGKFGNESQKSDMVDVINSMIKLEKISAELNFTSACEQRNHTECLPVRADTATVSEELDYIEALRKRATEILHS